MSIQFKPVKYNKKGDNGNSVEYYAPQIISRGEISFLKIRKNVSTKLGIDGILISQVLSSIENEIVKNLLDGYVVELGKLGRFYLTLEGKHETTVKKICTESILKSHIHFKAAPEFKDRLGKVVYIQHKES